VSGRSLTDQEIIEVRQLYASKSITQTEAAKRYGVSRASIWNALVGVRGGDLPGAREATHQNDTAVNFWAKVEKTDGCWLWRGAIFQNSGYGLFAFQGRPHVAHRIAWLLTHGDLPARPLELAHTCDVRACVRLDHLYIATHAENMADMVRRGRASHMGPGNPAKGERHRSHLYPEKRPRGAAVHRSSLTDEAVSAIRIRHAAGESQTALAKEFGVHQTAISAIVRHKTWTHLP
jgi:predicted DNA-binding protein (UPF0251 family)